MLDFNKEYARWMAQDLGDSSLKQDLISIENNEDEIKDRFAIDLVFGTAGLRGIIGAGLNRMNIYTVGRATQGFSSYINETFKGDKKVVIGYDSRIKSDDFAKKAATIFAANGIKAYIFPELSPTPMVSFAIRELNCCGGVMVTASHNPSKYNGYKAYDETGCQLGPEAADFVMKSIGKTDIFNGVKTGDFDTFIKEGKIEYISEELIDSYLDNVFAQTISKGIIKESGLSVVYTPLNGAGNKPVRRALAKAGIEHIYIVEEQENPDGFFPTCPYPNPEIKEALNLAIELSKKVKPDVMLATDPDADRVGIALMDGDTPVLLTGNETGILLFDYVCSQRIANNIMPKTPYAISTIVSSKMIEKIAANYGVEVFSVLTGFKFIGEKISSQSAIGRENDYIFGYEESYGYLFGTYARDKDSVVASLLICEMVAFYKKNNKSLLEALDDIYKKYGYMVDTQQSFQFEGLSGMEKMDGIMQKLRNNPPKEINGFKVIKFNDYKTGVNGLPKSNVLEFILDGQNSVIVRPSGTEPKIKIYYSISGTSKEDANARFNAFSSVMKDVMI